MVEHCPQRDDWGIDPIAIGDSLYSAYLVRADLVRAYLYSAKLNNANLFRAYLYSANLVRANLDRANLYRANLYSSKLNSSNLDRVNLERANLDSANLERANLKRVQALNTNFEGSTLTGACIEDWNINSQTNLQNVKCDYIYLKEIYSKEEQKRIFIDRIPHDPDKIFAPGEFTKRYQKILETVELFFGEGIDWQVFLASFQQLQEEKKLKIQDGDRALPIVQGIKNTGDGSFLIEVGVSPDTDKGEIEKSFWQKYQLKLEAAEERYRQQLNAKDKQISNFLQQNTHLMKIIEIQASQPININTHVINQQGDNNMTNQSSGNTYNTEKANIVHNQGDIKDHAKVALVINEAAQQDLTQAAAEIQQLLEQLSKTNPTETFAEKGAIADMTIQEIENNPTLKQKIISSLKAMSVEAFMELIDHPVANVLRAGIEAYREPN